MNKSDFDVLKFIYAEGAVNQRSIAKGTDYSLGKINKSVSLLKREGFLDFELKPTEKAESLVKKQKPERAVILAAGFGFRLTPICYERPKALLKVKGEVLCERIIRQLKEAGINEIYIVVGYMKEKFEYLIDGYGVKLIINNSFSSLNNIYSLYLVREKLSNCYIVPGDLYFKSNPFSESELYSWYMFSDELTPKCDYTANSKNVIIRKSGECGNVRTGVAYIGSGCTDGIRSNLEELKKSSSFGESVWEASVFERTPAGLFARFIGGNDYKEINTYEDLMSFDPESESLDSEYIRIICDTFKIDKSEIKKIESQKKGMTNRSFIFTCFGNRYIFRIPGEGTQKLINRKNEYDVYQKISGKGICDELIYINRDNGYKITKFIENSHTCDAENPQEVKRCMDFLREFHARKLKVDHFFDIFGEAERFEKLRGCPSEYTDYEKTKADVFSLKGFIDSLNIEYSLSHLDSVCDNFILTDGRVHLIDWEYASMQDPHVDIAMFAIYSLYNRKQVDELIDIYFQNKCDRMTRLKIYCYISACGLLWSNWCEYKAKLGVSFGEYSLYQYRYAKEYYRIFWENYNDEKS